MRFDPDKYRRRSIRLRGYDYSRAGAYFVTLCTHDRGCLFGEVVDREMRLNAYGQVAVECWEDLINHYPRIELDIFVVMPNHLHGIITLTDNVGAGFKPAPTKGHGLPEIVRAFKTFCSRRINQLRKTPGTSVWQRNYYEHIIRNESELGLIRQYIVHNPAQWAFDRENPVGAGFKPAPTCPPQTGHPHRGAPTDDIETIFGGERP